MGIFRNPVTLVVLLVLVILLFGANKLPGLARNMGESMRIFKSEVEEMRKDEDGKPVRDEHHGDDRERREQGSHAADRRDYDPRDDRNREEVREARDDYRRD